MKENTPRAVHLKDYKRPDYFITAIDLRFDLFEDAKCFVKSKLWIKRHSESLEVQARPPLVLDGVELELISIKLDGRKLEESEYSVTPTHLTLQNPPENFTLEIETAVEPHKNTSLEGLYKTSGMFCTQNEAQGFRKITYFLDRPDVLATYTTTIVADKSKFPVLLSNGNKTGQTDLPEGRHMVRWHDPFPKPCYLFAVVAGDLAVLEDTSMTRSGRRIKLQFYTAHGKEKRCGHALESLKKAMRWDEVTFGLEYDLDTYMVVAADDFNMGAMENKGLNIFNSAYVQADGKTATDSDYQTILGVIGHEYFHNWTGNRVTCRDWFQLSLKEGLTVFRDQEFSRDMISRAVKRIEDVRILRNVQFAEDAGPMAHPVRPESYIEINNFYTPTVYNKGAEVVRMLQTFEGAEGFKKGMKKYFELFDGQAVTTDDWIAAHEQANQLNFAQFKRWYSQSGTPVLKIKSRFDPRKKEYELEIKQSCSPTPGQPVKKPFHIPLAVGLIDKSGQEIASKILEIKKEEQVFKFKKIAERPVLSLLRGFSAPINVRYPYSEAELTFLMAHDLDPFSRWEAAQILLRKTLLELASKAQKSKAKRFKLDKTLLNAFSKILADETMDPAFAAHLLALPTEGEMGLAVTPIPVDAIHRAREAAIFELAMELIDQWLAIYNRLNIVSPYQAESLDMGQRALKNTALMYLSRIGEKEFIKLCMNQFKNTANMTDQLSALACLNQLDVPEREEAFKAFEEKWKDEALVMNKWFALQATCFLPGSLERIGSLVSHPLFDISNPNKVYSLHRELSRANPTQFHRIDGKGYRFLADQIIEIDKRNAQVAARIVVAFNGWRKYDVKRQALMKGELDRIRGTAGLSPNLFEIVSKALGNTEGDE